MAEPTRNQQVLQKLDALKNAKGGDVAAAKWDLVKTVFDRNSSGTIEPKEADYRVWRGGLGVDAKSKRDTRNEVEEALGIATGERDSKVTLSKIADIQKAAGQEPAKIPAAKPLPLDAALSAYENAKPGTPEADRAKTALLKTFFDLDGNGNIGQRDIADAMTQLKNWETITAKVPGAPSIKRLQIVGQLSGILDDKGEPTKAMPRDVANALAGHGLSVDQDWLKPQEKLNAMATSIVSQSPGPKRRADVAEFVATVMDKNGDGEFRTDDLKQAMKEADTDGNGKLSVSEMENLTKGLSRPAKTIFNRATGINALAEGTELDIKALGELLAKNGIIAKEVTNKPELPATTPAAPAPKTKGRE